MWITKHFDSKVKPYEDLSVSQDFVEAYVTEQNLSLKAGHMWYPAFNYLFCYS